jgi:predicted NBD/HSP70 family sugar kinase
MAVYEVDSLSTSAGHIFQLFRQGSVRTRGELRQLTGLSRSTVLQRVAALIEAGYLKEEGQSASTGGRPPVVLIPNDEGKTILTADLGATHGRLAVTDGAGRFLAETGLESRIDAGPEEVLIRVFDTFKRLLRQVGRRPSEVVGIGLGLPGPVDVESATVFQPPIMPGWHNFPIREFTARRFRAPVFVENDANLMAFGEGRAHYPDAQSLLFVKVATGIGAGLVINGAIYNGMDGGAGDIGHVRVSEAAGHLCDCGADGCLAAVAGGKAIARMLTEHGVDAHSSREVVRLVQDGNPDAVAATRGAGRLLGQVLATAVSLLNPQILVLGGDMGSTHEHFLLGMRESIYQRTQPLATRSLTIATTQLGDRAGVVGASELVRDRIFSSGAVDSTIASALTSSTAGGQDSTFSHRRADQLRATASTTSAT